MHLYKTPKYNLLHFSDKFYMLKESWDILVNRKELHQYLKKISGDSHILDESEALTLIKNNLLPPIGSQEVWAAGVTYLRSRDARMDESKDSGAADCYQRVYEADRPELFFKSLPHRVAGHGEEVHIRQDSDWNVPEPELTLFINSAGDIQGYTIGNDMSSRSIEGENPLYLPQAKIYERSAALGPCLYIPAAPISRDTRISMKILRKGSVMYENSTTVDRMKRSLNELAAYLYRECDFSHGCYLMTGTCLVPPNEFTLLPGDVVEISITSIGQMVNTVGVKNKKSVPAKLL